MLLYTKLVTSYDGILASLGTIFACEEEEKMLVSSNGVVNLGAVPEKKTLLARRGKKDN